MKTITTRARSVEIPTHVSELTPEQYEYYVFLAHTLSMGSISGDYFRIRWFSYLIGLDKADFTVLKPKYIDELESQIGAIDGFFVTEGDRVHLDFSTPVNLLPSYGGYQGPGDWLEGVTYGTFVECLTIAENINQMDADAMAEGYAHIARKLYNIPDDDTVPDILVFHAPMLLSSVWKALMSAPVEINGKKIDFRIIFRSSGNKRSDDKTGWTGITFEVAAAGLFGSVAEVERTDMWAVLIYLYKCKFEYLNEKRNTSNK